MEAPLSRFARAAVIGALPVISVCCFTTLVIYSGNSDEFSASYFDLQIAFLPYVLTLIGALGVAGLVMTRKGFQRYLAVLCVLAILVWLQSNILVWDYGVLDGRSIPWGEKCWAGVFDLTVWSVALIVAITAFSRFRKPLLIMALVTFSIQLVSAVVLFFDGSGADLFGSSATAYADGQDEMPRFSKTSNIVHIVMDGFQADVFGEIVAESSTVDFQRELRGFTFFEGNLGAYPFTQLTIPALVSGKLYRNEIPVDEFVSKTMRGATIVNAAYEAGYEVDIASQAALTSVYSLGKHHNTYGITTAEYVTHADYVLNDSAKLIDLALFRSVPHFGKALVHRDELWVFQGLVRSEAYLHMQYFADLAFLSRLAEQMSADRAVPVYKLFHLMLSHQPTVGNEQCEFDGKNPTHRNFVKIQARCGLLRIVDVLRRMKQLGIYDNSLIVLMADHGAWVDVVLPSEAATKRLQAAPGSDRLRIAMATPALAIKPPGSNGDFRVSGAPTSITDVPATIAAVAGFDAEFDGRSVLSMNGAEPRVRHHLAYPWGTNTKAAGYLFPIQEYQVIGDPYDPHAWRKSGKLLPKGRVQDGDPLPHD